MFRGAACLGMRSAASLMGCIECRAGGQLAAGGGGGPGAWFRGGGRRSNRAGGRLRVSRLSASSLGRLPSRCALFYGAGAEPVTLQLPACGCRLGAPHVGCSSHSGTCTLGNTFTDWAVGVVCLGLEVEAPSACDTFTVQLLVVGKYNFCFKHCLALHIADWLLRLWLLVSTSTSSGRPAVMFKSHSPFQTSLWASYSMQYHLALHVSSPNPRICSPWQTYKHFAWSHHGTTAIWNTWL